MRIPARKVSVVKLEDHDALTHGFELAVRQVPDLLPSSLPGQVLIKPNLSDIMAWDTGVTTDPRWLGVLAAKLRDIRPDVRIRVVESDGIGAYTGYRSCEETFERLGFVSEAEQNGIELINLSMSEAMEIRLSGVPKPVIIPQIFLEEMFLISIANLKAYEVMQMAGILENSLGFLPESDISAYESCLPTLISQLHLLLPPDLCIIDGRVGLRGQRPNQGDAVRLDTLILGRDALAVDETCCRLLGIRAGEVLALREAAKDLGRNLGEFEIVGDLRPHMLAADGPSAELTNLE